MKQALTSSPFMKVHSLLIVAYLGRCKHFKNEYTKNDQGLQYSSLTEVTPIRLLGGEYTRTIHR